MLPNFVCPGAARSATTALYYLLIQHPQIFLPALKETRFFSRDYQNGLAWYEQKYYANVADETAVGDISPVYLIDDRCAKRIHDSLGPETKLIFMLRDPVERAYSHYCMLKHHHFEDLRFEEALALPDPERVAKSLKRYEHEYGFQYLKESAYFDGIQRYLEYFRPERIKYVLFEEFVADPKGQLLEIRSFLGVSEIFEFDLDVYKNPRSASGSAPVTRAFYNNPLIKKARDLVQLKTGWKTQSWLKKIKTSLLTKENSEIPPMDESTRQQLYEYFADETERLESLVGQDLSGWKKP